MGLTWGQFGSYLISSAKSRGIPLFGQFELTSRCNLRCGMCYVSGHRNDRELELRERSTDDWLRLAEAARDAGMLYLMLTGGEVLLRKDFKTIYEELSQMGLVIQINTNATLVTPELAKWLGSRPPSKVTVSVYGASPDTYYKICKNADGYLKTIQGIEALLSEGIQLRIRTTVVRGNAEDFEKLTELTQKYGKMLHLVSYIYPVNSQAGCYPETERLSALELIRFQAKAEEYYARIIKELPGEQEEEPLPDFDEDRMIQDDTHPFQCISGKCRFSITWDGRMVPCVLMQEPTAYPFDVGFLNAWSELRTLCSKLPRCRECIQCIYNEVCMSCPASRRSETGSYDKPVPYLCAFYSNKYKEVTTHERIYETNGYPD